MWEAVDYDNPLVYTGCTTGKVFHLGKPWYTMDIAADMAAFMVEVGTGGSRKVPTPMPYKGELTSDLNGVCEQEHKWFRSVMGSLQW